MSSLLFPFSGRLLMMSTFSSAKLAPEKQKRDALVGISVSRALCLWEALVKTRLAQMDEAEEGFLKKGFK